MCVRIVCIASLFCLLACSSSDTATKKNKAGKSSFVYRETLVQGTDTGMIELKGFKRNDPRELFYQVWHLVKSNTNGKTRTYTNAGAKEVLALFRDSAMFSNSDGDAIAGSWYIDQRGNQSVLIIKSGKQFIPLLVVAISSTQMQLASAGNQLQLQFEAEGMAHKNPLNDPFHPVNTQWLIHPVKKEPDSVIRGRVKQCLRFYALYFRDHIKRKKSKITFEGLPDAFDWYEGGISLPDRDLVSNKWIRCFYNEEQSLKGYNYLHQLMKDYDFEWPKGAPNWIYRTHSVLEQMYIKMK